VYKEMSQQAMTKNYFTGGKNKVWAMPYSNQEFDEMLFLSVPSLLLSIHA
jgi:hypothetical protein